MWRPWLSSTMMCPSGPCWGRSAIRPCCVVRRCASGEVCPMRPPGVAGKATVMPVVSPLPASSRFPCVETSCALVLHLAVGHAADVRDAHREDVRAGCLFRGGLGWGGLGRGVRGRGTGAGVGRCRPAPARVGRGAAARPGSTAARKRLPREKAWIAGGRRSPRKSLRAGKPDCFEPAAIDLSRCVMHKPNSGIEVASRACRTWRFHVEPPRATTLALPRYSSESLARRAWAGAG